MRSDDAGPTQGTVDDDAFAQLVGPHRARLRAHCYRMLGSVADSEDAVQDTMLRAWRSLDTFEGRSSIEAWLTAIATNVCLRMLEGRRRRRLPADVGGPATLGEPPGRPLEDSVWIEPIPTDLADLADPAPGPEARYTLVEATELAFTAALQHLPPFQRAVLVLRHVLGYSAIETATLLTTTVPAANSALQRARTTLRRHHGTSAGEPVQRPATNVDTGRLAQRYAKAIQEADPHAVVALLTADATWSMPPEATWYRGIDAIVRFLRDAPLRIRWRHLPARANGQTALMCYGYDSDADLFRAEALDVLDITAAGRIRSITAFRSPASLARFQLPATLPAGFTRGDSLATFA